MTYIPRSGQSQPRTLRHLHGSSRRPHISGGRLRRGIHHAIHVQPFCFSDVQTFGMEETLKHVGVEPAGTASNSIELDSLDHQTVQPDDQRGGDRDRLN